MKVASSFAIIFRPYNQKIGGMGLISTIATIREQGTDTTRDFDQIVLANQKRVFRVLMSQVSDASVAEDLTQECFLRAYRSRGDFRGEAQISTWLIRIAINLARDYHRSRRVDFWKHLLRISDPQKTASGAEIGEEMQIADLQATPERQLLGEERVAKMWAAVHALPVQQREVFSLRFMEELPLQEIADCTGLRLGTVKCQLYRAIAKLRRELGEQA
jgi:RNA polymerase sigma-70 factor (ECF subfamily)